MTDTIKDHIKSRISRITMSKVTDEEVEAGLVAWYAEDAGPEFSARMRLGMRRVLEQFASSLISDQVAEIELLKKINAGVWEQTVATNTGWMIRAEAAERELETLSSSHKDLAKRLAKAGEDLADALKALEAATVEVGEAADKMHVLGLNHPGGSPMLNEDRTFMLQLARRFNDASSTARSTIARIKGVAE